MHCLLKWLDTEQSKEQCPLDRRKWGGSSSTTSHTWLTTETADRKPDRLPTTVDGAPMASMAPGPITGDDEDEVEDEDMYDDEDEGEHDELIEYDEDSDESLNLGGGIRHVR